MPGDNQNKSAFPQSDLSQSMPSMPGDLPSPDPVPQTENVLDLNTSGQTTPGPLNPSDTTSFQPAVVNSAIPADNNSILNPPPAVTTSTTTTTMTDSQGTSGGGNGDTGDSSVVTSSSHVPKKYGGQKVIATIFSILFVVGAVVAGVVLVQRQQLLEQEAASGSECDQSIDCELIESTNNAGSYTADRNIIYIEITDQERHKYFPGNSDDGCRRVNISGNTATWERYGSGNTCREISNVQIWMGNVLTATPVPTTPPATSTLTPTLPPGVTETATPTTPPATSTLTPTLPPQITAKCNDVNAYDENGNLLTTSELSQLKEGDEVVFAVSGQASSGTFSKARFTVNGSVIGESTTTNSGGEYYIEFTIPGNTSTFSVKGEVFHSSLGWI